MMFMMRIFVKICVFLLILLSAAFFGHIFAKTFYRDYSATVSNGLLYLKNTVQLQPAGQPSIKANEVHVSAINGTTHGILVIFAYARKHPLTHISLVSFFWDISKQCKTRSPPQNPVSDQVLHRLLTEVYFKI